VVRVMGRRFSIAQRLAAIVCLLALLAPAFPRAGQLYATMHIAPDPHFRTYVDEGIEGVVVTQLKDDKMVPFINGLIHGGRPSTMSYMEAAIALSYANQPSNVLDIGLGGGGTLMQIVQRHPGVQKITLVELNSTLIRNQGRFPGPREILADPRLNLVIDDGRRFLLSTKEQFDLILMDPLRSTTAYSNNLYSRQFFALVKQHVAPGGIFMVWADEVRVVPKTLHSVFPHILWYSVGRENICVATDFPLRLERVPRARTLALFSDNEQKLISTLPIAYLGDGTLVDEVCRNFPVNQDWRPVCEYYLGLKVRQRFNQAGTR
jgi:predicted membrane-bound spermidine synthase